jgi:SpoVK/Ycf46/Vps4 family AAA+-type ATPase
MNGVIAANDVGYRALAEMTRLYSGADLTDGLVEEVKRLAFDESIRLPGKRDVVPVSMRHFLAAIENWNYPSVGAVELIAYGVDLRSVT